jgi:hypothetical protein
MNGYLAAAVGWDPESVVDLVELKENLESACEEGPNDARFHGLVISESLSSKLSLSADYMEFQAGYLWMPWRGEGPAPSPPTSRAWSGR